MMFDNVHVQEKKFYNLWGSTNAEEEEKLRGIHKHIPAPKRALPSHAESYNPPPEYLLDAKEVNPSHFSLLSKNQLGLMIIRQKLLYLLFLVTS